MNTNLPDLRGRKRPLPSAPGLSPADALQFKRAALCADVLRVARGLGLAEGCAPGIEAYVRHGRHGASRVRRTMGARTWTEAMERLGLVPAYYHRRATVRALVADVRRVAILLGRPRWMPTPSEYDAHGRYSGGLLILRLGEGSKRWGHVALHCGLRYRHGNARPIANEDIIARYVDACRDAGLAYGGPGLSEAQWTRVAPELVHLTRRRWRRWSRFVEAAGYLPDLRRARRVATPTPEARAA